MADARPDPNGETRPSSDRGSTTSTPRWLKVFGIITLVGVLLFAALMLAGGGHGPGLHGPP